MVNKPKYYSGTGHTSTYGPIGVSDDYLFIFRISTMVNQYYTTSYYHDNSSVARPQYYDKPMVHHMNMILPW